MNYLLFMFACFLWLMIPYLMEALWLKVFKASLPGWED